jgi:ABC-type amino acid transport system permease subunit
MAHRGHNNEQRLALLLCMLSVGISGVGFVSLTISTVLSIIFALFLISWSKPLVLPALAVLWIRAVDFFPGTQIEEKEFGDAIFIAGFPITLQLFTLVCITSRTLIEWLVHPRTFLRSRWRKCSFVLWFVFFVITFISAFWGKSLGNENWTQPLRASMSLAALFYGAIMAEKIKSRVWVMNWLLGIAGLVLVLIAANLYWNHVGFFYVALGGCAFWYVVRRNHWVLVSIFGVAPFMIAFVTQDTLTLIASTVCGLLAGSFLFLFHPNKSIGRSVTSIWTMLAFPISVLLPLAVLISTSYPLYVLNRDASFGSRLMSKFFLDRGTLWRAAWDRETENPEVLSPAGGGLAVNNPTARVEDDLWKVHIHNSYLEMLRQTGILGGAIFLILVGWFWLKLRNALLAPIIPIGRAFAGASLVTILVGATTGLFPFDFHAGPWVWLWAGTAVGLVEPVGTTARRKLAAHRLVMRDTYTGRMPPQRLHPILNVRDEGATLRNYDR